MSAIQQLLTEHMAIWTAADTEKKSGRGRASGNAGSVYGIKKLRELILELAVRGKLVPQDPNDEPASELLKHIQAEKTKLVTEGKIKKDKPLVAIADEDKPFELPNGWEWIRNNQLFQLRKGRIPKTLNESGLGLPYLDIDALDRNIMRRYSEELTCPQSTDKDILVVCDGSRSGLVLDGKNGIIGSTLSIIDTPVFIQNYIKLIFKQGFEIFNTSMKGAAIPHLDTQKLLQNPTALPPLSEQHRIVTKVDELMALCDQLETQHSNAEEAHEKLVSHLLGTLTQSQSVDDFSANWQRIAAHFDTLFTTETSIDELKQTLLQLAVMGKLTKQTSTSLLEEMNDKTIAERGLLKLGKGEQANLNIPIKESELPFQIPSNWGRIRLGKIVDIIGGSQPPKSVFIETQKIGYTRLIQIRDFKSDNYPTYIPDKYANRMFEKDDIMIGRYGPPVFQILRGLRGTYNVALMKAEPINEIVSKDFLYYLLSEPRIQNLVIKESERTAGQTGIRKDLLYMFVVGLPPKEEQYRIVAKVDELMALCDQLKTLIQQANQQQQSIANVLVAQVLK
jgi:type I restriction enzyme S subunit